MQITETVLRILYTFLMSGWNKIKNKQQNLLVRKTLDSLNKIPIFQDWC